MATAGDALKVVLASLYELVAFLRKQKHSITSPLKIAHSSDITKKYSAIEEIFGKSRQTVSNVYHRFRFVVLTDYQFYPVKLVGLKTIVEIDDSLFAKVKSHRGKDLKRKQVWVFGLSERKTGKCYFEIGNNDQFEFSFFFNDSRIKLK